ncbi:MAG: hypothetical protein HYS98_07155, partial [Deltaproteobacteria bacterium]|nr:hypothetical protein [Deltaproteobacteria bacterium]
VAAAFNRFYLNHKVVVEDRTLQKARVSLVAGALYVLGNGLKLLSLSTPSKM